MTTFRGDLFAKVEFRGYDVLVPFVCRRCGECCLWYVPWMPEKNLRKIAGDLGLPAEEILQCHQEAYQKRIRGQTVPCPFIGADHLCTIHGHPLRPDSCSLSPFSFDKPSFDTPACHEHRRIVEALTAGETDFEIYDSSFCPEMQIRPVPEFAWPGVWRRFLSTEPTLAVVREFLRLNRLPPETTSRQGLHAAPRKAAL